MADKNLVETIPSKVNPRLDTIPNCGARTKDKKKYLVRLRHVTKLNSGEHVALEHDVDLSKLSEEQRLEFATNAILIAKIRPLMRDMKADEAIKTFGTDYVFVADPESVRSPADPVKKVSKGVKTLDFSQTVEFLITNFGMSEKEAKATAIKKFKPES